MSAPREGPNPLRPYYVPPSVGNSHDAAPNISSASNISSRYGCNSAASPSFGSSARNILADMDYTDYLSDPSPSSSDAIKILVEQALWKYTSVFLMQPLEVAKTVLQVRAPGPSSKGISQPLSAEETRRRRVQHMRDIYKDNDASSDSDLDSPSYFTSAAPYSTTASRQSRARRRPGSPNPYPAPDSDVPQSSSSRPYSHTLDLKSPSSLSAVLSSLWQVEGAWGIWKGTNSTYVHSILLSTITSFTRSFLAAIFAVSDPSFSFQVANSAGGIDILSSPSPMASLAVAVSAAGIAGFVLAPFDIARTKLILTPSTHPPRSIRLTLQTLPSWIVPASIAPITMLHSMLPTFISTSLPLFLRSKLSIDPLLTPNVYAVATFIGQGFELAVKLPLETILRRGQLHIAKSTLKGREMQTVVEAGPYKGVMGTAYSIIYEEGDRVRTADATSSTVIAKAGKSARDPPKKKGQGPEGLWRGWRIGMWGLIGVWGAATLGGVGNKGGEF